MNPRLTALSTLSASSMHVLPALTAAKSAIKSFAAVYGAVSQQEGRTLSMHAVQQHCCAEAGKPCTGNRTRWGRYGEGTTSPPGPGNSGLG